MLKKVLSLATVFALCITGTLYGLETNPKPLSAKANGYTGTGLSVRPVISFEEPIETLVSYNMLSSSDNKTFTGLHSGDVTEIATVGKYAGICSAKINFSNAGSYSEVQIDGIKSSNKPVSDWTGAEYIQFYVKNTSSSTIVLDAITLKQVGYNSRLKRSGQAQMLSNDSTSWSNLSLINEKDNANFGSIPIPSKFVGFIRISLSSFADGSYTFNPSVAVTGLSLWYFMASGNGQTIYMDDIAVVGQKLASDIASQQKTVLEATYFASFYEEPLTISKIAGNGSSLGDGGSAMTAQLNAPRGLAFDSIGNLYIADCSGNRVRKIDKNGIITTVAGNGTSNYSGDGGIATNASVTPWSIAFDSKDNLYISDQAHATIRKVDKNTGIISTIAGNGNQATSGDNIPATNSYLNHPTEIDIDSADNLYIAEYVSNRIRKINLNTGIIKTVAGNGTLGYSGNGGAATSAQLNCPFGITVDTVGNLYISDSGNNCIRKVDTSGIITTVMSGYFAYGLTADISGNVYVMNTYNHKIDKIDNSGYISQIAGNGTQNYSGDNGDPLSASLSYPFAGAVDGAGNLYFSDNGNNVVRVIGKNSSITHESTTYYVSVLGNDSNTGSQAMPFKTINHAAQLAKAGDIVIIREGTYRETITPANSGKAGKPITYRAATGEKVVINGCDIITGWSPYQGSIYQASMPWTMGKGKDQVFIDGEVVGQARYPQANSAGKSYPSGVSLDSPLWPVLGDFTAQFGTSNITSLTLLNQPDNYWKGAIYNGGHGLNWAWQSGIIDSSTSGSLTIGKKTTAWWFNLQETGNMLAENQQGYITDSMNCLTYAGAWQNQNNMLYLWTPDSSDPSGHVVEAKKRQLAFDLRCKNYIEISGIDVFACSMTLNNANYCTIDRCNMSYISHYQLWNDAGWSYIDEYPNMYKNGSPQRGEVGIYIYGTGNTLKNSTIQYSAGAGIYMDGYGTCITNTEIHDTGYAGTYPSGIYICAGPYGASQNEIRGGYVITHNDVYNTGRGAFAFSGAATHYSSDISYNKFHDACILTAEDALFYTWGVTLNAGGARTQVHHNLIYNQWSKYMGNLVYFDNNTYGIDVHDNLLFQAENPSCVSVNGDGIYYANPDGDGTFKNNRGINLSSPSAVTFDSSGNMYIGDYEGAFVDKVDVATDNITRVVGTGQHGYRGDNMSAIISNINHPDGVAVDSTGNVYIVEYVSQRVRKVNTNGVITTIAGNGTQGYSGDGGLATNAQLSCPRGIAVDNEGNLYIADTSNHRIRKVDTNGIITTVAGNGSQGYSGNGGPATSAALFLPFSVSLDNTGNMYISDTYNHCIRKVNKTTGIITTIAGNGSSGYTGDNGQAISATLCYPKGATVDSTGNLYITDANNNCVRKVNTSGIITTIAGTGTAGYSGDNGIGTGAMLKDPHGIAVKGSDVYIGDAGNGRIRKIDTSTGIISTVLADTCYIESIDDLTAANYPSAKVFETGFIKAQSISLDKSSGSLTEGQTEILNADVLPSTALYIEKTWSTSNPSVATVENGVVTAVAEGTAVITATAIDGGYTATYTVTVNPMATFGSYVNSNNILTNITPDTTVEEFQTGLHLSSGVQMNIKDANGNDILTSQYVRTGATVYLTVGNNTKSYTLLIYGDINCDGRRNVQDLIELKNSLLGNKQLDEISRKAVKTSLNDNSAITITDLLTLKDNIVG